MTTLVFVYGTLKRGQCNHHRLADSRFIGEARTEPKYRLFRIDWYPGLVEYKDGVAVEGELWEVNDGTLRQLDEYEGVPTWFERRSIEIDGVPTPVEAYFYKGDVTDRNECGTRW